MANNQEFYCEHCKKNTLFFLESDLLWYCDECGNVLDSLPGEDEWDELEDEWDELEDSNISRLRCPGCNRKIGIHEMVDGYLCPNCFEDLSDVLEKNGYSYDEDLDLYIKKGDE